MRAALPLEEAQRRLTALATPLGAEAVPVGEALGRYLAESVVARRTQPAADLSAMDGYAVGDLDAGHWHVVGESAAGHPYALPLQPGEAVRISTGALMPTGSGGVLLEEEAIRQEAELSAAPGAAPAARHIRRRGFDFHQGDSVLEAGLRIGPAQLALAITAGHGARSLRVGRRPRLAVIDSGDELARAADAWEDHRLPASNGAMIAAMAAPFASSVDRLGPVPDRLEALTEALEATSGADVVVTSGGASIGDHDLIRPALAAWGAEIDFWRVAIKPGKPLLVARKGETFILGLPGNPVSSYVTAFLFLLPLLRRLAGAAAPAPRTLRLPLRRGVSVGGQRLELIRAHITDGGVAPIGDQDSSALRALALSDALIRREIDAPPAQAGELATVYPLENGGIA